MKRSDIRTHRQECFTRVELLAVIGILAAILLPCPRWPTRPRRRPIARDNGACEFAPFDTWELNRTDSKDGDASPMNRLTKAAMDRCAPHGRASSPYAPRPLIAKLEKQP